MTDDDTAMPPQGPSFTGDASGADASDADAPDGLELEECQIREMRSIFATSLPQYLEPLEEMCRQLLSGTAGPELVAGLRAATGSLLEAAEKMSFHDVADLLGRLEQAVDQEVMSGSGEIPEERREVILGALLDLRQVAEEFGSAQEKLGGTPLAERLAGMPEAAEVVTRLARAGLVLDEQIRHARPDEIAAVSGLTRATVANVLAWLQGGPAALEALAPTIAPVPAASPRTPTPVLSEAQPHAIDAPAAEAREDGLETLLAALERLAGRLEETRHDIQARQAQLRTLHVERDELEQERDRSRAVHKELERWAAASGELRARLLGQRDLYVAALHATEQRLAKRRAVFAALEREVRDQMAELAASREALRQLESMTTRLRSRFERRRIAR